MAPEAISGSRDLDARSDIWATGVILHELLTARPLFASKNEYQTLMKVQKGDILPPSTFNQACPPELDGIVFRALARHPDERFANAAELREELLAVKKQYSLQSSVRDVAGSIDWAFGLEPPPGFTGDTTGIRSAETQQSMPAQGQHTKTRRPTQNPEEEAAVEVVWGSGAQESGDHGPVVLEDVPDVSEKHQRPKRDTEEADEGPTPLPRHGTMPSIYGEHVPRAKTESASCRRPRTPRSPSVPMFRSPAVAIIIARSMNGSRPCRGARQTDRPDARGYGHHSHEDGLDPGRASPYADADDRAEVAADHGRRHAEHGSASRGCPRSRQRAAAGEVCVRCRFAATNPLAKPLSAEDLFGIDAGAALATVSAQLDARPTNTAMPAHRAEEPLPLVHTTPTAGSMPSVPVVRFSKSMSVPPVNVTDTPSTGFPVTRQGFAPVSASQAPHRLEPRRASSQPANVTSTPIVGSRVVAPKRTLLFIIGGVILAGGTAAIVAMALTGGKAQPAQVKPEVPVAATKTVGTLKFVTEPADAQIKIGDKLTHDGTPFSSELPAGIHQIEIHRAGYKSWLTSIELSANEVQTVRVVLEPLTNAAANTDATLTVATTPAGLDVIIDGTPFAKKTPIETTLKVGPHSIVVKQDGVEVWRQSVNAEASSDYEFNPSFTADKQRERAERATKPAPAPKPQPAPPPPAPAPAEVKAPETTPRTAESVTKSMIPAVVNAPPKPTTPPETPENGSGDLETP